MIFIVVNLKTELNVLFSVKPIPEKADKFGKLLGEMVHLSIIIFTVFGWSYYNSGIYYLQL